MESNKLFPIISSSSDDTSVYLAKKRNAWKKKERSLKFQSERVLKKLRNFSCAKSTHTTSGKNAQNNVLLLSSPRSPLVNQEKYQENIQSFENSF